MNFDHKSIARRIKNIREIKKVRGPAIKETFGISDKEFFEIESGHKKPPLQLLHTMYERHSVNLHWLFGGHGEIFLNSNCDLDEEQTAQLNELLELAQNPWYLRKLYEKLEVLKIQAGLRAPTGGV
jgi:hypothetical protein